MTTMPCISIRQPWAGLILVGGKDVENRTWRFPPRLLGQSVLIHAGKKLDKEAAMQFGWRELLAEHPSAFCQGGIVGIVRVILDIRNSTSRWAIQSHRMWHWLLSDARTLPFFACKGRLGVFNVEYQGVIA